MFIPKPGTERPSKWDRMPIPTGGLGRIRFVLATHFFKLMQANLFFILFSLPVITIPTAFTAMTAVVQALFRDGQCYVWEVFWREFRTHAVRRTAWSLLLLALPVGGWFLGGAISELMAYALAGMLLVAVMMAGGYWFPQMASLTISPGQCLRNAFLLVALETKANFFLLVIEGVAGALTILAWPFSVPVIVLVLPVWMQLLVAAVVNPVLDERLVIEKKQEP